MNTLKRAGEVAKLLVAAVGAVSVQLTAMYPGHLTWLPGLIAGMSAALVYLVPNSPPAPPAK